MASSHQDSSFVSKVSKGCFFSFQRLLFQSGPRRLTSLYVTCVAVGWVLLMTLCPCWPLLQDEPVEWETPDLSQAEVEQKIKEYNSQINSNLFMSLVS